MTVLLALASAALFGIGVALQQRPASAVPDDYAGRLGLLGRLIRRPGWLLGVVAEIAGFVVQVVALHRGSLVVVQPVITTSLIFTVAMAAVWSERKVSWTDWVSVAAVVAGLALFLVAASPREAGGANASATDWAMAAGSIAVTAGALLVGALRSSGRTRAALFGVAAGLGDASMAVVTKAFSVSATRGVGHLLVTWTPYTLVAVGVAAMVLTQSAYQTGRPAIALPLITVVDPLVSSAIGIGLFGEVLHLGGLRAPGAACGVLVMAGGLLLLSRSPYVVDSAEMPRSAGKPAEKPVTVARP